MAHGSCRETEVLPGSVPIRLHRPPGGFAMRSTIPAPAVFHRPLRIFGPRKAIRVSSRRFTRPQIFMGIVPNLWSPERPKRAETLREWKVESGKWKVFRAAGPASSTGPTGRDRAAQGEGRDDRSPGFDPDWLLSPVRARQPAVPHLQRGEKHASPRPTVAIGALRPGLFCPGPLGLKTCE